MATTLVAYFSATGTTARVAQAAAKVAGADLFEIQPVEPYTSADLNWNNKASRSSREMADESSRPVLAGGAPDMGAYDTVLVGFPIWWYVEPRIVDTFVEAAGLAGKTVVPFATSGGSGMGSIPDRIQRLCPEAEVVGGRRLRNAREAERWVAELDL